MFDWVFTGFYQVLLGFTGFYRLLLGFPEFERAVPSFYRVSMAGSGWNGFTGFYWVLPSLNRLFHGFWAFFCYYWAGRDSFTNDGRELIDPWFWPYVKLGNRGDFTGGRAGLWPC